MLYQLSYSRRAPSIRGNVSITLFRVSCFEFRVLSCDGFGFGVWVLRFAFDVLGFCVQRHYISIERRMLLSPKPETRNPKPETRNPKNREAHLSMLCLIDDTES